MTTPFHISEDGRARMSESMPWPKLRIIGWSLMALAIASASADMQITWILLTVFGAYLLGVDLGLTLAKAEKADV